MNESARVESRLTVAAVMLREAVTKMRSVPGMMDVANDDSLEAGFPWFGMSVEPWMELRRKTADLVSEFNAAAEAALASARRLAPRRPAEILADLRQATWRAR